MSQNSENLSTVRFEWLSPYKDLLDTANSITWFLMDGLWMMGQYPLAFLMAVPVVLSGVVLALYDRRGSSIAINLGILSWIFMNLCWMTSDVADKTAWTSASKYCFFAGLLSISVAALLTKDLRQTFSQFRRFRVKKWD